MPLLNSADILTGIKAHWYTNRTLAELVPGGLHHGRPGLTKDADIVREPYATLKAVEQPPQFNSSTTYYQSFLLTLTVWSEKGNADAGRILRAIDLWFDRGSAADAILVPGMDKVLDLMPVQGDLGVDEATHLATDQAMGVRAWEMIVQATRDR